MTHTLTPHALYLSHTHTCALLLNFSYSLKTVFDFERRIFHVFTKNDTTSKGGERKKESVMRWINAFEMMRILYIYNGLYTYVWQIFSHKNIFVCWFLWVSVKYAHTEFHKQNRASAYAPPPSHSLAKRSKI